MMMLSICFFSQRLALFVFLLIDILSRQSRGANRGPDAVVESRSVSAAGQVEVGREYKRDFRGGQWVCCGLGIRVEYL